MSNRRECRGMTLLEVIAALTVAGFALLGAILLLDQVTDAAARIAIESAALALRGNGARVLRQLLLDAHATPDSIDWFHGDTNGASFTTRCSQAGGWDASCRVALTLDRRRDSTAILAELSTGDRLLLAQVAGAGGLRFFDAYSADSIWKSNWIASVRLPTAIGLVSVGDTAIYLVGGARE